MEESINLNSQSLPEENNIQVKKHTKFSDIVQFTKIRLASLVVLSAALCYLFGADEINSSSLIMLVIGGFFVTAASNGFNQIIEKDLDKLMNRTAKRPLPDGRMSLTEAYIISITFGVVGLAILYIWLGLACFLLGLFALISYTFIYTPLKQKTPFAVFVGAFPGAIPPLLGYVAATGRFDIAAWLVFGIQFLWQFPHFWAIAWVLDDDYKRAGFKMLPSTEGRDKNSAFQIMVYTFSLIPIVLLPYYFHLTGITSLILNIIFGILFSYQSIKLYQDCSLKSAKNLMFGSFAYLPLVQLAMYLDKI
ncbi:MAG: heme o synthase [Bacteroidota bacterium]